ncbi:MAG: RHS repeat-associated core domain-containing protein [Bdellovibrionales bacterium]|nr:RHS repeat-associated core domain-containing protein [Bdellovibrionales bacterium]
MMKAILLSAVFALISLAKSSDTYACHFDSGTQTAIDAYYSNCFWSSPTLTNDPPGSTSYWFDCPSADYMGIPNYWPHTGGWFNCTASTANPGAAGSGGPGGNGGSGGGGAGGGGGMCGGGPGGGPDCDSDCCSGGGGGGAGGGAGGGFGGPAGDINGFSTVQADNQSIIESVPIVGTPFTINYNSARALGRTSDLKREIDLMPSTPDSDFVSRYVTYELAGRVIPVTCTVASPCSTTFTWDGLDNSSIRVMGSTELLIRSIDTHSPAYPNEVETVGKTIIGNFYAITAKLGGWTLSPHHFYDRFQKIVFRGDGSLYATEAIKDGSGNYQVTSEDGSEIYIFNPSGVHQLTKTSVKGATKYTFSYSSGRLTSITDAYSNVTSINYDMSNFPASIVGPYGQTTTLSVDGNGNLNSIENPNSEEFVMTYHSGSGGLLHTFTKPGGAVSTMTYDSDGLLTSDSSSAGGSLTLTRTGSATSFTVTVETAEGIETTYNVANASPSTYSRSSSGSGTYFSTGLTYSNGVPSTNSITDTFGASISKVFASDSRTSSPYVAYQTVGTTNYTQTIYRTKTSTLSDPDDIFSATALSDVVTINSDAYSTTYDSSTSTYTHESPEGRMSYTTIDSDERIVSAQVASYTPVEYNYDANGRLENVSQGANRTIDIAYDADGYVESVTNAYNEETSFVYDDAGRVLTRTLPDARVITYTYDDNGNVTSVTPPSNQLHEFEFNGFDLLSKYIAPAGTVFSINKSAHSVSQKMKIGWNTIIKLIANFFAGWFPSAEAVALSITTDVETDYAYNNDRQIELITRPTSDTIAYSYNATTGRLETIVVPTGTYTYSMDGAYSRYGSIESPDGVIQTYTYDAHLILSKTNSGTTSGAVAFTYTNDFSLNTSQVNTETAISYSYDDDNLIVGAGDQTISRFSATGFPQTATLTNVSENYTYDSNFGELASIQGKYSTATNIYQETISRDYLGRISTKVETIGGGSSNTYLYAYDSSGRLVTVLKNSTALASYTYDSNSNRTSQTISGVTKTATYDEQDRIVTHGTKTYQYDDAGDLTQKSDSATSPASVTTYDYDVMGNLKSITMPNSTVYTYLYDGKNKRVGKKVGGTLTRQYVWFNGTRLAAELDSTGGVISEFVYGIKRNVPDYIIKSGTKYKVLTDHLGSVVAVANASTGVVAQAISYDEFGRVLSDSSPGFQPFGFAGGMYDSDTGLVRFGARDYDAEIGRWTIKDPILFKGGDTNLYGYVMNDPVNFKDSQGLSVDGCDSFRNEIDKIRNRISNLITDRNANSSDAAFCAEADEAWDTQSTELMNAQDLFNDCTAGRIDFGL